MVSRRALQANGGFMSNFVSKEKCDDIQFQILHFWPSKWYDN